MPIRLSRFKPPVSQFKANRVPFGDGIGVRMGFDARQEARTQEATVKCPSVTSTLHSNYQSQPVSNQLPVIGEARGMLHFWAWQSCSFAGCAPHWRSVWHSWAPQRAPHHALTREWRLALKPAYNGRLVLRSKMAGCRLAHPKAPYRPHARRRSFGAGSESSLVFVRPPDVVQRGSALHYLYPSEHRPLLRSW